MSILFLQLEAEEEKNIAAVQTLRGAFTKAERAHPGLCQQFLSGVMDAEGVSINLPEAILRLACYDCEEYRITCTVHEFQHLQQRAMSEYSHLVCMYTHVFS